MEFLGGLLSGGASLLGGMMNNSNQQALNQQNNMWNAMMQIQNQQWQTQMSNTAYQRGVSDMKAAGLNPMMMFGSGGPSSTPSVSTSSGSPAQVRDPISPAVEVALRALGALKEVEQKDVQNQNIAAQTGVQVAQQKNIQADTANRMAENPYIAPKRKAELANLGAQTRETHGRADTYPSVIENTSARTTKQLMENQVYKDVGPGVLTNAGTWRQFGSSVLNSVNGIQHQTGRSVNDAGPALKRVIDIAATRAANEPSALRPPSAEDRLRSQIRSGRTAYPADTAY